MSHEGSICLAQTAHGRVNLCDCGCASLTFGLATLHFESEAAFEAMAIAVLDEESARTEDEGFEMRYDWFSVSLSPLGAAELARLMREALDALWWTRGDLEFTDEDFRHLRRDPL